MEEHIRPTSSEARSAAVSDLQSPTTVGGIRAKTTVAMVSYIDICWDPRNFIAYMAYILCDCELNSQS
ncbi:hypothetical protein Vadar_019021 [Vaccinium darrowii]|uniref:Uncharacterized protein n=1 Tax=Vaccinium darrowii TaxID=229202 RepID=A0ACB7YFR8_9ERIC|nr:hypothetical protein Vadar_019021 [Vaccinium darrowii]